MNANDRRIPVVFGPTAVGKSALALALAKALDGEIVSLDSRQMVRGMDIGTAKPSAAELAVVPHHLVDIAGPELTPSMAEVQALAYGAISEILGRGRRPVLAGGTGQYLRAILEGWTIPEVPPDKALRAELEAEVEVEGTEILAARLARLDPAAALTIDPRNLRRLVRALEVIHHSGRSFSSQSGRRGAPYPWLIVAISRPREVLYARIDRRIDAMLAAGLEDEVRGLVAAGHSWQLPAMRSVGYQEWAAYFSGDVDRAEALRLIRHNTRRMVRSQDNWLRNLDLPVLALDLGEGEVGDAEVARVLKVLNVAQVGEA